MLRLSKATVRIAVSGATITLLSLAAFGGSPKGAEFKIYDDESPRATLHLGGRSLNVVIDTGATYTIVDKRFRRCLGKVVDSAAIESRSATSVMPFFECGGGELGGLSLSLPSVICVDLGEDIASEGVDGLIGMDFLIQYTFEIDWDAHVGRISADAPESIFPHQIKVPLTFSRMALPCVTSTAESSTILSVGIDTGAVSSISLGSADARKLFPNGWGRSVEMELFTVHGASTCERTRLTGLTIGSHREQNLLCDIGGGAIAQTYVGCGFLRRFHVVFDFPGRTLTLIPRQKAISDEDNMSGIHVVRRQGAVLINQVDEDSPAMRAGLRGGERLDAVDGAAASGLRLSQIRARFEAGHGKKLALTVSTSESSRTVEIVLQRRI